MPGISAHARVLKALTSEGAGYQRGKRRCAIPKGPMFTIVLLTHCVLEACDGLVARRVPGFVLALISSPLPPDKEGLKEVQIL